jgi:hypothetical protein
MNAINLDARINVFLQRKYAEFPDIADAGRHDSRTVKYARALRTSGQLLMPS